MAQYWQKPGVNLVGEYQVAGHILVHTGSSNVVNLNFLGKSITPIASTNIYFYDVNNNEHSLTGVPAGTRIEGKFIKYKCSGSAVVEVTSIPASQYIHPLSASIKS